MTPQSLCLSSGHLGLVVTSFNLSGSSSAFPGLPPYLLFPERTATFISSPAVCSQRTFPTTLRVCPQGCASCSLRAGCLPHPSSSRACLRSAPSVHTVPMYLLYSIVQDNWKSKCTSGWCRGVGVNGPLLRVSFGLFLERFGHFRGRPMTPQVLRHCWEHESSVLWQDPNQDRAH